MPYLCGFLVIFPLRYFFDSFLPWLNENRNAVFMRFSGCFSLRYLIIYVWSATNNGRRLVFHLLRREVIDMVTFTDLFTYTLVLCAVVTLVVTCCNKPKK
nr:MAG TPA: hypothetical protein [Inoviridae sp.]